MGHPIRQALVRMLVGMLVRLTVTAATVFAAVLVVVPYVTDAIRPDAIRPGALTAGVETSVDQGWLELVESVDPDTPSVDLALDLRARAMRGAALVRSEVAAVGDLDVRVQRVLASTGAPPALPVLLTAGALFATAVGLVVASRRPPRTPARRRKVRR